MKILIRQEGLEDWELVEDADYAIEAELQQLLAESPSLISIGEIRVGASPLIAAIREIGLPGSGNTDILAFNAQGDIVVVECKLAANQDIKRKVIAQVLEYGAHLWGMTYDELNAKIYSRTNITLADFVAGKTSDPTWDEEVFRSNIEENLSSGSFVLVIAVDEMNDELNRTMRFINTCGNPEFDFTVLEMKRFHQDQNEILVPHLHSTISQSQAIREEKKRKQWTENEFLEVVTANLSEEVSELIIQLYEWSIESADRVWFGTGKEKGSFTYHHLLNGKTVSVFSVYTNGDLVLNFGWLLSAVDIDVLQGFHDGLTQIKTFQGIPPDLNRWPSIKIDEAFLGQPEYIENFMVVVENFVEALPNQSSKKLPINEA